MVVRLVGALLATGATALVAYTSTPPAAQVSPAASMSADAKAYLDRAITLFREQHINANKMNWPALTEKAYAAAAGARSTADTYSAIRLIIKALGEKHTTFVEPDLANAQKTSKVVGSTPPPPLQLPEVVRLAKGIGAVRLHSFLGSPEQGHVYSSTGESKIEQLQRAGVCKFVVDLSLDKGGNMYPMLQAVSGLLNEGVLGTFENARGQFWPWVLKNGTVTQGGLIKSPSVHKEPGQRSSPVAVILGPSTASAGEFIAMSFEGRPNTRFFGAPTAGYVTANQPITLSDGAVIVMTSGWGLDQRGKKYLDSIQPDVNTGSEAAAINAAITWLSNEHCARQTRRTAS